MDEICIRPGVYWFMMARKIKSGEIFLRTFKTQASYRRFRNSFKKLAARHGQEAYAAYGYGDPELILPKIAEMMGAEWGISEVAEKLVIWVR